jgi:hypothetical protein
MGQGIGLGKALGANAQNLVGAPADRADTNKANYQKVFFEIHGTGKKVTAERSKAITAYF